MSLKSLLDTLEAAVQATAPLGPMIASLNLPVVSEAANVASAFLKIAQAAKEAYQTGQAILGETDAARLDTVIDQLMAQAATEAAEVDRG